MILKLFLIALFNRLRRFSKSNALGLFFGLSGGAILYWLDVQQHIDLYSIASTVMNILCMLGIECVTHTSEVADAADKLATVNAFIGISSLGISWVVTEAYEMLSPKCETLQQLEKKAEALEDKLQLNLFGNDTDSKRR